mmetsp:Transcript_12347/g.31592  ORF Transcript_12347/g.31592 Transcript_12347/m.31592 type:complete len:186 (+) Transcript_12347:329-886(+)
MMSGRNKRASPLECSLAGVVASFEGVPVVVELRNESLVKGTLDTADVQMNLHMSNVTYTKFQVRVAVPGKSVCMCASQNLCLGDSEAVWATLLAHRVVCDKYLCQICPCLFPKQGSKQQLDSMYVRGTNIRMIHLPPRVDCAQRMREQKRKRMEARAAAMKSALGPQNAPHSAGLAHLGASASGT